MLLRLPERVAATLTAFGGGILFAAIALRLLGGIGLALALATVLGFVAGYLLS